MSEVTLHPANPDDEVDVERERQEQARELVNKGVQLAKKLQARGRAKETVDDKKIHAGGQKAGHVTTTITSEPINIDDGSKVRLTSVVTTEADSGKSSASLSIAKADENLGDPQTDYFVEGWLEAHSSVYEAVIGGRELDHDKTGLGIPDMQEADASGELDRVLTLMEQQATQ